MKSVHIVAAGHSAGQDLAVLSNCHHVILSLGTYGWFAAYLSSRQAGSSIVYHKDEFVLEHNINRGKVNILDYFPPSWVAISQ